MANMICKRGIFSQDVEFEGVERIKQKRATAETRNEDCSIRRSAENEAERLVKSIRGKEIRLA
jgi:hypothetical protein